MLSGRTLSGITLSGSGTAPKWERRHGGAQAAALGHDAAVVAEERSLCAAAAAAPASSRMDARDRARSSARALATPSAVRRRRQVRAQVRARAAAPADRRAPHAARRAGVRAHARVCVRACEHSPRRASERWLRCDGRADRRGADQAHDLVFLRPGAVVVMVYPYRRAGHSRFRPAVRRCAALRSAANVVDGFGCGAAPLLCLFVCVLCV